MTIATHAKKTNQLLKEVLEMSDVENSGYLLDFLYQHARRWATKQYCMTETAAAEYAAWYLETFGDEWVREVTAPPHSGWTIFKYGRATRTLVTEGV